MKFNFANKEYNVKIWNGEVLGPFVSIDTETEMVDSWTNTPTLATIQVWGIGSSTVYYVDTADCLRFLEAHRESTFIMQNAKFDVDVLHKHMDNRILYDWYDANRIHDTKILYQLLHLASAGWVPFKTSLGFLSEKFLGEILDKEGTERVTFGQYVGRPVTDISEAHLLYGAKDPVATGLVYQKLREYIQRHDRYNTLLSHDIQVKGDLALSHIYKNGIGFDIEMRDAWMVEKQAILDKLSLKLSDWGWIRGMPGIKTTYEYIINTLLGLEGKLPYKFKDEIVERLPSGRWIYRSGKKSGQLLEEGKSGTLTSSREDLAPYKSRPFIDTYLDFVELEKATTFVRDISSNVVNPRYNLLVNTGRTSCSGPNFQQLPRMGGIREMFRANAGNTLLITDYSAIELSTLSQVMYDMFGESVMKDKINEGIDLHKYYASIMYGCSVANVTKQQRQEAKAANFGFPGGLGIATFIEFSRGYGLDLSTDVAQRMKDTWFNAFPETRDYMKNEKGMVYTKTGRKRNYTSYCAEKNTPFQGLAADGAKMALYNLDREGFKVVGFVHDEIICEVSKENAKAQLPKMEQIMVESMQTVVPDVAIKVESQVSERYCK